MTIIFSPKFKFSCFNFRHLQWADTVAAGQKRGQTGGQNGGQIGGHGEGGYPLPRRHHLLLALDRAIGLGGLAIGLGSLKDRDGLVITTLMATGTRPAHLRMSISIDSNHPNHPNQYCPGINLDKLWSLVSEQTRVKYQSNTKKPFMWL